jgi:hypothetical protein
MTGLCISHLRLSLRHNIMAIIKVRRKGLLHISRMSENSVKECHSICCNGLNGGFGSGHCFYCRPTAVMSHVRKGETSLTND